MNKTYLPILGAAAVLLGIALESAYPVMPWPGRAELAHLFGFAGILMYIAGLVIGSRQHRMGWQPLAGICAVALLVCLPSYLAPDWLKIHRFLYFRDVGHVIAPSLLVCALSLGFARLPIWLTTRFLKSTTRSDKTCATCIIYGLWAIALEAGSIEWEICSQPFACLGGKLAPRGYIEWWQVGCDALGIMLGFWISKSLDPTSKTPSQTTCRIGGPV